MKFLVVDDNSENRFLLSKTLLRHFPHAALIECQSVDTAVRLLRNETVDLIIAHRCAELLGAELIQALREVNEVVPIIAVSGVDRRQESLAAGATRFHSLDQWLLIGAVAAELLHLPRPNDVSTESVAPFDVRTNSNR